MIKLFYPLCGIFYKQYICDQLSGSTCGGGSCPLPCRQLDQRKHCLQTILLQHKPKLLNVLDYIDIHDYVSPSLLLLLLPLLLLLSLLILLLVLLFMLLATVLRLYCCCVTALLLLLLPNSYALVAVPATHTDTKVSSDVT